MDSDNIQPILDNTKAGIENGMDKANRDKSGQIGLLTEQDSKAVRDDLLTAINIMTHEFQTMCQNISGIVHHTMAAK